MQEQTTDIQVQDLINDFAYEIGTMRGQMILDKRVRESEKAKWEKERESYVAAITDLTSRLDALEKGPGFTIVNDPEVPAVTPKKGAKARLAEDDVKPD